MGWWQQNQEQQKPFLFPTLQLKFNKYCYKKEGIDVTSVKGGYLNKHFCKWQGIMVLHNIVLLSSCLSETLSSWESQRLLYFAVYSEKWLNGNKKLTFCSYSYPGFALSFHSLHKTTLKSILSSDSISICSVIQ